MAGLHAIPIAENNRFLALLVSYRSRPGRFRLARGCNPASTTVNCRGFWRLLAVMGRLGAE